MWCIRFLFQKREDNSAQTPSSATTDVASCDEPSTTAPPCCDSIPMNEEHDHCLSDSVVQVSSFRELLMWLLTLYTLYICVCTTRVCNKKCAHVHVDPQTTINKSQTVCVTKVKLWQVNLAHELAKESALPFASVRISSYASMQTPNILLAMT